MANDVMQLVLVGVIGNEFAENVLYFQSDVANAANPVLEAKNCVDAFIANVQNDWMDSLPNDYELHGYKCKRVNNTGGPTYMAPIAAVAGGRPAASLVSSLAPLLVSSYVETATMKHRTGRIFMPGIADGDVIENELGGPILGQLNAVGADLLATSSSGGQTFTYGIWSRKYLRFYIPPAINISLLVGTQRRRLHPVL